MGIFLDDFRFYLGPYGLLSLILLAGLQAIPKDLYEAALMDKASPIRTLWRITLPLLMPNLIVVLVLAMIRAVQVFDEVFVLTGGGTRICYHLHCAIYLPNWICRTNTFVRSSSWQHH
jgi:ABC-type sugar transport system permease subunit